MSDIFYLLLFKSKHQIHSQISSILIKIVITATLLFPFFFLADPAQNDLIKIRNLHHQLAGCLIWFWQVATKDKHYQSIFWSSSLWPCVRQYVVNSLVLDLWCFSSRKVRRVSKCLKLQYSPLFQDLSIMPVEVSVEYCGGWGYGPRYRDLAQRIAAEVPGAEVKGFVGRRSSFEVKVNDTVCHTTHVKYIWGSTDEHQIQRTSVTVIQGQGLCHYSQLSLYISDDF